MAKSTANDCAISAQTPWIYNSWLDMMVGCGAWSAPLLLLAYLSAASNTLQWSIAFYVLALFFNYPHYMATVYRAYRRAEDFEKYRVFTLHPVDTIKNWLDSLPKAPELPPPNADQHQMQGFQKKMADYTNMMQMLSNVLRMLEDNRRSITGNIRA